MWDLWKTILWMAHFNDQCQPRRWIISDFLLCPYSWEKSSPVTRWRKQTSPWKNAFRFLSFPFPYVIFVHAFLLYISVTEVSLSPFPSKFHLIRWALDSLPANSLFTQQRFSGYSHVMGTGDTVSPRTYVTLVYSQVFIVSCFLIHLCASSLSNPGSIMD